jgi:hypothetical protein
VSNSCWHLLANDRVRSALLDEPKKRIPELAAFVVEPFSFASAGETLAGETCCENWSVSPSGKLQGPDPAGDSGKKVTLGEAAQVVCSNICN